uniref:Uncharacterized protein n=1 Tax=Glossina pallidipes TaxID=7398 RepID=A0A1A9ZTY0_GLOPL
MRLKYHLLSIGRSISKLCAFLYERVLGDRGTKQQQQQQQKQQRIRIITTSSMPYSVAIVDNHLAINALNNGRSVGHKTMEAQYVCVHITQLYLQNHDSHTVPANKCGR